VDNYDYILFQWTEIGVSIYAHFNHDEGSQSLAGSSVIPMGNMVDVPTSDSLFFWGW